MKSKKSKITNKNNKNTLKKQKGGTNSAASSSTLSAAPQPFNPKGPVFVPGAKAFNPPEFTEKELLNLDKVKMFMEILSNYNIVLNTLDEIIEYINTTLMYLNMKHNSKFMILTNVVFPIQPVQPEFKDVEKLSKKEKPNYNKKIKEYEKKLKEYNEENQFITVTIKNEIFNMYKNEPKIYFINNNSILIEIETNDNLKTINDKNKIINTNINNNFNMIEENDLKIKQNIYIIHNDLINKYYSEKINNMISFYDNLFEICINLNTKDEFKQSKYIYDDVNTTIETSKIKIEPDILVILFNTIFPQIYETYEWIYFDDNEDINELIKKTIDSEGKDTGTGTNKVPGTSTITSTNAGTITSTTSSTNAGTGKSTNTSTTASTIKITGKDTPSSIVKNTGTNKSKNTTALNPNSICKLIKNYTNN